MADNITTLASRLEPILRKRLKPGNTTIINQYITETGGGGGGPVDLSWVVPKSFPMIPAAPITISSDFWGAGMTFGLSLDSNGGLEVNSGNLRVKLPAAAGLTRNSSGLAVNLDTSGGIELSSNALRVKLDSPSYLNRTSNGVAVAQHPIISLHSHSGGAALDVVGLSGASTLAMLTPSSDVGTSPVAAILKSTGTGGLTLKTLAVKGNLDVTDGGDFYVAGSGAYAGNPIIFADSNGGNVGIMGTPDPQFALDVFGPVRAQYFIGPHAIQLKNVLLLSHFDGRQPFETNYYGEPNGHMGQVGRVAGGVIYREGIFGTKAVQIAQGTTNLIVNPSFEVNATSGWTFFESGSGGSVVRSNFRSHTGTYSGRILPSSTGSATIRTADIAVANGQTIHFQARVWRNFAGSARLEIWNQTAGASAAFVGSVLNGQWEHLLVSWTNSTGSAANVRLYIRNLAGGTSQDVYVDSVQAEIGTVATPYADGTLGDGHSWSGTAHNSTSTRTIANFRYPTAGNVNTARGTVMAWVYRSGDNDTDTILQLDGVSSGLIYLRCVGGQLQGAWGNTGAVSGGTVPARVWTHVAMTSSGSALILYVNGVQVASGTDSGFSGLPTEMYVGRSPGGGNFVNGLIDDLVILSQQIPANEVRAIYESNAPVFAESSRFSFRATPRNLVWADDDGLWMRDTTGNAVFGFYGGEATGYTWGGALLDPGDILFGRYGASDGGWMLFDRDGVSSKPFLSLGYADKTVFALDSGGATLDGVLDISTNGGIVQGSGTQGPASVWNFPTGSWTSAPTKNTWGSFTGFRMGQSSGIGLWALYKGGDAQVWASTTGRMMFALGNAWLDEDGLTLRSSVSDPFGAGSVGKEIRWVDASGTTVAGIISMYSSEGLPASLHFYSGSSPTSSPIVFTGNSILAPNVTSTASLTTLGTALLVNATVSGTLTLGGTSDNIARLRPAGNHTVANNGTLNLGAPRGFVFVQNTNDQHGALYYLRGTTAIELLDSNNVFSPTQGTASSNNIYHDGSVWRLENTRGSSKSYEVIILGRSTDF